MKHLDVNHKKITIGATVHVPAIEGNVNNEFVGTVDSFNPTDDYVIVVDQEGNAFCVEPELLELEEKQYLVTWVLDVSATSPEEAAKLALEVQRDKESEALAFTIKEQATGEETDVDLLESWDESQGSDICYGCGKVQEYQTMQDVDKDDFAIYCTKCLGVGVSKIDKINKINAILKKYGSFSVYDISADSSPRINSVGDQIALVEYFYENRVIIYVYNELGTEMSYYYSEVYENLPADVLDEILTLANQWVEVSLEETE